MIFESWCIGICLMFWRGRYCYGNKDIISCSLGKPIELNLTFLKIRAYIIGCRNQKDLFTWGGCCSVFVAEPWQRLPSVLAPSTPGIICVATLLRHLLESIQGIQPFQYSFGDGGMRVVCCHSWQVLGTQKMVLMHRSHRRMDQSLQLKRNSFIEIQLMYHKIHPFFVYLQSLCSHYQCVISEYFHHLPLKRPVPFRSPSHLPIPYLLATTNLFSVCGFVSWTLQSSRIVQYSSPCDWLHFT